ncbi:SusC/RagA family TonB-linked outer membrane protein [Pseudobacter ginsenosidimutans]|jgi:TonB-linked SusC/RagA family outer membrane protein|uniref:TonB-linked SusC/RagA family outer membrane protein n=1 Tax=Pseudobacter ginsenosidimutans TaxID=661488 RepID=A0A4V2F1L4_9BACT|nr:TonB-dependent receptor [Pseudobacter ginsenosidimutans]QEC42837.1 TonB-dependent receptor [Pseudobacter ginsenosidimutans]RZS74186.1 TonB-linked SusC/RagA family outer membrane protein [Pseudobacter ginsenosidimutans]
MPGSTHWVKHYAPLLCLLVFPVLAFSQSRTLTGKVTARKDNQPVSSVSIQLKGRSAGTSTGDNGEYSITVTSSDTIIASSIGYRRFEAAVKDLTTLNIVLEEADDALADVVVVGYGTQKKGDLTGSLSSVNSKDIKSLPVSNAGDAIQGRAAGVQIVSSGSPGSNATIRIRGIGTINNSDPLLVIDGVPTDVPLNTISPDDIASIEILKDASAAAIYGSRGANGVVLISTKRGVSGKGALDFKAFYGSQNATSMVDLLNASQFASLHNEMMSNNGQAQNPAFANPPSLGAGTNWLDLLFRSAPMQNYSMAYSGGGPKSTFYVSGAMLDQQGIVINTSYKRYTLQFNHDSRVFDWLRFGNNLTMSHDIKKNGSYDIRNTMAALPTQAVYNADGSYAGPVGQPSWVGDIANPIGKATINDNKTAGYNILGNVFAELTLFKDLKFKTTGGMQAMFWDSRSWSPKYNWQPIPQPNSSLFQQYNKSLTWLWDNYFTYERSFQGGHRVTAMAGTSAQTNRYDNMDGSIQKFASNATQQLDNGTVDPTVGGTGNEWALLSFIGRINYAYKSKYLLTATIRRDGSSRFGDENKYGTFPSASAAWRISEEDFFKDITFVNDLKLRAGYGVTGNQNIGNYSFASVLQTVQYNFNGTPVNAIVPQAIPNPGVRWEKVEQANIGIDASFLRNRVNVTLDAYLKNTRDMLVPMSVPISTGYSDIVVPSINLGHVQNRGIELAVNTKNLTGEFEWNTSFNVSYNQNRIMSLNDSVPLYAGSIGLNQNLAIQHAGGYPVNEFYGFVTSGIFQNQKEVDDWAVQVPGSDANNRTSPGDVKFRDLNNDGQINDDDRTFIGNPNPSFIFAMNNNFAYRGFDLSIFLQGIAGNDIYNANRIWQEGMAVAQNQTTAVLDRWRGEGTSNSMPRAVFNDPNKNTRVSDRFVEDGSYLRIKNITLGYTLPRSLVQRAKMSSLRVYISCQNLVTFTKYTGFDPEVPSNGIDLNVYPVTRTISAGINLSF